MAPTLARRGKQDSQNHEADALPGMEGVREGLVRSGARHASEGERDAPPPQQVIDRGTWP